MLDGEIDRCVNLRRKIYEDMVAGVHRLEIAFSLKNPWIALFQDAEIPETINRTAFRKLAERVIVAGDYRNVAVECKAQEMKKYLPESWWDEKED